MLRQRHDSCITGRQCNLTKESNPFITVIYTGKIPQRSKYFFMATPKAFLFDLNGTMIDDMEYHTQAWFQVLNEGLDAGLSWEAVKKEMYGKNEELLVRIFGKDHFSKSEIQQLSFQKEQKYQEAFLPNLKLIAGLEQFLQKAHSHGCPIAIGSAAIMDNVDFVLDNLHIRHFFKAIVSADDVAESKPHPETFLEAAWRLQVAPDNCIVFEDAPKGVEAAQNAGMQAIALTTVHPAEDFRTYSNVLAVVKDYNDPRLNEFFQ